MVIFTHKIRAICFSFATVDFAHNLTIMYVKVAQIDRGEIMATIRKIAKSWWIDYRLHGERIRKRIGRSKAIAEDTLSQIKVKISRANAKGIITSFYEEVEGCQICGYNLTIEEHHFIPRSQGGSESPANKIKLCPNHHRLLHLALQVLSGNKRKNVKELKNQLERILKIDEDFALFYQRNAAQFEKMKEA